MRGGPVTADRPVLHVDRMLLGAVLALTTIGLVMVYSASAVMAQEKLGDGFYFLKRQLGAGAVGLGVMALALRVGYRKLARLAYPLLIVAVVTLVLVAVPGVGTVVGGARRWIKLGPMSLQPAELTKLAWVIYLSYSLAKKGQKVRSFTIGLLPHFLIAGVLVLLCMKQPDFGSSVALAFLLFVLLFVAGARLPYLVGALMLAAPLAYYAVASSPYRMKRILAFLDPWEHRHDAGYQVAESLMSVGSGGVFGLGLGDSRQKLFFLPEAHTDFIFSIIGEEMGLVGAGVVIALYVVILWRGIRAAARAAEPFGTYLAAGLTSLICFQASVNMAVAMGLLPTKGLTLPFVSYGGSSLMVLLGAAGILLSVEAQGAPLRLAKATPASPGRLHEVVS
ncbi:MAG: putative lipid II flippase FtsW [Myxococcaceae bacterium]